MAPGALGHQVQAQLELDGPARRDPDAHLAARREELQPRSGREPPDEVHRTAADVAPQVELYRAGLAHLGASRPQGRRRDRQAGRLLRRSDSVRVDVEGGLAQRRRARDLRELGEDFGDIPGTLRRVLGDAARDERAQRRRNVVQGRRNGVQDVSDLVLQVVGLQRVGAGEQLVEHEAEGVDIGPAVHRLALQLLGRHVGRRAGAGPLRFMLSAVDARQAEVGDLQPVVRRDEQVAGLDVPVHDADALAHRLSVSVDEPRRALHREVERAQQVHGALGDQMGEVVPVDELEDEERAGRLVDEPERLDDVLVTAERDPGLRLAPKRLDERRGAPLRSQGLDGVAVAGVRVRHGPQEPHPATEDGVDTKAVEKSIADVRGRKRVFSGGDPAEDNSTL